MEEVKKFRRGENPPEGKNIFIASTKFLPYDVCTLTNSCGTCPVWEDYCKMR